jgi:hypothetical protein
VRVCQLRRDRLGVRRVEGGTRHPTRSAIHYRTVDLTLMALPAMHQLGRLAPVAWRH